MEKLFIINKEEGKKINGFFLAKRRLNNSYFITLNNKSKLRIDNGTK